MFRIVYICHGERAQTFSGTLFNLFSGGENGYAGISLEPRGGLNLIHSKMCTDYRTTRAFLAKLVRLIPGYRNRAFFSASAQQPIWSDSNGKLATIASIVLCMLSSASA